MSKDRKLLKIFLATCLLAGSWQGSATIAQEETPQQKVETTETPETQEAAETQETVSKSISNLKEAFQHFDVNKAFGTVPGLMLQATKEKSQRKQLKSFIYAGYGFLLDSNPEAALNCFNTACAMAPTDLDALCYRSEALKQLCRFDEQKNLLTDFENLQPKTGFVYEQLAKDRLRKKNGVEALKLIDAGLALEKNNCKPALLILKARACSLLGLGDATTRAYKEAADLTENQYIKEILLADSCLIESDLKGTKQHILAAGKLLPDDPIWQYKLGNYYAGENDNTKALEHLLAATVTSRLSASAYINLASEYGYDDQYKNALKALEHIASLLPNTATIYGTTGDIHKLFSENEEALKSYDKALDLDPYLSRTYFDMASLHIDMKHGDRAIALFEKAIALMPSYWRLRLNHAEILWRLQEFDKAREECLAGLNLLSPLKGDLNILASHYESRAHAMLCSYFYRKKELPAAIAEAVRFNETKYIPTLPRALSYVKLRPERLVFASDLSEHDPVALTALGDALYEVKDYEWSEKEYRKAIKLSPEDADLHSYLLNVLTHKRDWSEAARENFVYSGKLVNKIPGEVGKWLSQDREKSSP